MFLSPEDIKKVTDPKGINLEEEGNRFVYLFERENGQKAFLRIYDDNQRDPRESEITAALKRWLSSLHRLPLSQDMVNVIFTKAVNVIIVHLQKSHFPIFSDQSRVRSECFGFEGGFYGNRYC